MQYAEKNEWLDCRKLHEKVNKSHGMGSDRVRVEEALAKGMEMKGIGIDDVAVLCGVNDPEMLQKIFDTAKTIKNEIYGHRLVFFAPLYVSNYCANECSYCAFKKSNKGLVRHALTQEQIRRETEILIDQGHKRVLLVAGEQYPGGLQYILDSIETIYSVKKNNGEIRRMNVNIAPLSTEEFKLLKNAEIGTYQLFQETYDRRIYSEVHTGGKKKDFEWRLSAIDRAMEAGIDDVGIGALFGLADWRFEVLALMTHAAHLEERFGCGCHTISVPRIEPAFGSDIASSPPYAVSDDDFKKLVAILRIAVPYTGIIMSTREDAAMRRATYSLGVSQISAGSRTNPGGYAESREENQIEASQFQLGDHRELEEVVKDAAEMGYMPSFCTACYRLSRTGEDFMDLAKAGDIKHKCGPNSVGTFLEYLIDYAGADTVVAGEKIIENELADMDDKDRDVSNKIIKAINKGKRDVFC